MSTSTRQHPSHGCSVVNSEFLKYNWWAIPFQHNAFNIYFLIWGTDPITSGYVSCKGSLKINLPDVQGVLGFFALHPDKMGGVGGPKN